MTSNADNESFTYDVDGNRLTQNVNGVATTFVPSAGSNRLDSWHRSSDGWTELYNYDPEGNLVSYTGGVDSPPVPPQMFFYTGFDRLNGTYVNGLSAHFDVDPEGQRLRKWTSTTGTYFAPDVGGTLLAEDLNGTWYDYVYLNGRPVEVIANGGVFSLHDDQTGRPQVMTEPNSTAIDWKARTLPFDRTVVTNAWGPFNLGFPGQYNDTEDGLWYNGARDYDATLGRYIEGDPIGLAGGINTYAYVGNNPISEVDPLGLCECTKAQQIAAKLAALYKEEGDAAGTAGLGLAGASVVAAGLEAPTLGGDTPVTGGLLFAASRMEYAAITADTISAALNTYASGGNFGYFRQDLASGIASSVFKLGEGGAPMSKAAADLLGNISGKSVGAVTGEPQPPCQ